MKIEPPSAKFDSVSYLPHHPVFMPGKTSTKLRIVFDASAKDGNDASLNDNLFRGLVLLNDLIGVWLKDIRNQ